MWFFSGAAYKYCFKYKSAMESSLLWQKLITGLKGLNVILIWPLCNESIIKFHQNFTGSTLHSVQIVNKVWFWDNDGMC